MKRRVVFRLDAGMKRGLGHLSRCLSLALALPSDVKILFVIKTDSLEHVQSFVNQQKTSGIAFVFKDASTFGVDIEFGYLASLNKDKSFFILDTYDAVPSYQKELKRQGIRWLQFDSHAKIDLYADMVLHGSPGASFELYKPLMKSEQQKLLLGTKYAILASVFREKHSKAIPREKVKTVFICFGGGDDKGATFKIMNAIKEIALLNSLSIQVFINERNPFYTDIIDLASSYDDFVLNINKTNIAEAMLEADLAFIAPGTLSYEAACLGLPMLLVSIASNQLVNAKGWEAKGCAEYLGSIESIKLENINASLENINENNKLTKMSINCLNLVDGEGALRASQLIDNFFNTL